ncbi:MAG: tryptophan-rich sensory protein [Chloroflexota bacterium]|nr:tryptophan-rich sensory protein [Chloroflexota bacterium]
MAQLGLPPLSMLQIARERQLLWLLGLLGASYGAAGLGNLFTLPALDSWYRRLRKPSWTPSDRVFGPVWIALYTQMAVAAWLVVRGMARQPAASRSAAGRLALLTWWVQLVLNVSWSAAFFGSRSPAAGVLVIIPLSVAIASTAALAARVTRAGALLLLPYLAWTGFATALNVEVWRLNRRRR